MDDRDLALVLIVVLTVTLLGAGFLYDYVNSSNASGYVSSKTSISGEIEKIEEVDQPIPQRVNPDSPTKGTKIATFRIDDMSCGGCLYTIRQALSRVNGVKGYNVYLGRPGKAVVEYNSEVVSLQEIADAITNSGYPATIISKEDAEKISGTTSAGAGCDCGCGG